MEKTMSVEERIRRAEERYNKKNGYTAQIGNSRNELNIKNKVSEKKKTTKKLLMQIFVCLVIYVAFYSITNRDYIFSDNFKNDVNIFLKDKTKIYAMYENSKEFVNSKILHQNEEEDNEVNNVNEQTIDDTNNIEEQQIENTSEQQELQSENIGGADESIEQTDTTNTDNTENVEKSQMEIDADKIKSSISFINPIEGRITSTFGWRNPTVSTVPKYHTGLDIAAVSGTVIKSATDGKVIMASSKGDYGNHYQIQINDVIIIYAHCQKLYLKEGDSVVQGQEIGEVGSTGNSTGPHLHFEVRIEDRKVDPQLILNI